MQIALNPAMPTYSGGLGILAGDTLLRSLANPDAYARVMRGGIAANGSFFTHPMVSQYLDNAWFHEKERDLAERSQPEVRGDCKRLTA